MFNCTPENNNERARTERGGSGNEVETPNSCSTFLWLQP